LIADGRIKDDNPSPLCTSFFASPVLLWEQFFFPTAVFIAPPKSHIALSPTTTCFILSIAFSK